MDGLIWTLASHLDMLTTMVLLHSLDSQATNHEIGKEFQNNFLRSEMWTTNLPIPFSHFFIGRNFLFEYLNEIFINRLLKVLYTAFIFRGIFLKNKTKQTSFLLSLPFKGYFSYNIHKQMSQNIALDHVFLCPAYIK